MGSNSARCCNRKYGWSTGGAGLAYGVTGSALASTGAVASGLGFGAATVGPAGANGFVQSRQLLQAQQALNLVDSVDDIAQKIVDINSRYATSVEAHNSVKSILNSAMYYESKYDQVVSIVRSITQHTFIDGNKRTAFDVLNMLLNDFGLSNHLADNQKWKLINNIAQGVYKNAWAWLFLFRW